MDMNIRLEHPIPNLQKENESILFHWISVDKKIGIRKNIGGAEYNS
jgi:hypothetical protein